jgi:hypothetical protein
MASDEWAERIEIRQHLESDANMRSMVGQSFDERALAGQVTIAGVP